VKLEKDRARRVALLEQNMSQKCVKIVLDIDPDTGLDADEGQLDSVII